MTFYDKGFLPLSKAVEYFDSSVFTMRGRLPRVVYETKMGEIWRAMVVVVKFC